MSSAISDDDVGVERQQFLSGPGRKGKRGNVMKHWRGHHCLLFVHRRGRLNGMRGFAWDSRRSQDSWKTAREAAEAAFDFFVEAYGAKYDKAVACLAKDREALLTFYDFPAEHWKHVRTANPIESTFATVRLRTTRTKGCLSRRTALTMVFRLCQSAQQRWRRLDGPGRLAEVVRGVRFVDGERQVQDAA